MNKWIIVLLGLAAVAIAIMSYFLLTKKQLVVQAALGQSQTVTLSNNNPSQSVTLNIPYNDTIGITVNISNAAPNSSYTVSLSTGASTTITTDSSGSGSTSLSIPNVTSSTTVTLSISGPYISSPFTLSINLNVAYNPTLTVSVGGSTYTMSNSSSSASASLSATSASLSFTLSNAPPGATYTVTKSVSYIAGTSLTSPTTSQFTETAGSNGSVSWSDSVSIPSSYSGLKVTYTVTGPGIVNSFSFTLTLIIAIQPYREYSNIILGDICG